MTAALLFDTHILLWSRIDASKLNKTEREAIANAEQRFVSPVSFWEIGYLINRRRIITDIDLFDLPRGCEWLPLALSHCRMFAKLPLHHRDPFDRMLIAQSRTEGIGLLTRDQDMLRYGRLRDGLLIPD